MTPAGQWGRQNADVAESPTALNLHRRPGMFGDTGQESRAPIGSAGSAETTKMENGMITVQHTDVEGDEVINRKLIHINCEASVLEASKLAH